MTKREKREGVDPRRSLRLLWRLELSPKRGPKPSLSIDEIVSAAIAIADDEGVDAISMRRLGERLGTGTMTLYTYVPARSDLLDLMYDRVVGEQEVSFPEGATLRERLEILARGQWDLHQRHHWIAQMPWTRVPLGPNVLDAYERAISAIDGVGLSGREMNEILTLVSSYVHGAARLAIEAITLPSTTSIDDTEWWARVSPVLEEIWDPRRFPTLSSPQMAQAWDQAVEGEDYFLAGIVNSFEFGLARVLDGIEAFIQGKEHSPDSRSAGGEKPIRLRD
jgi:AcrR family transcriptional regulator